MAEISQEIKNFLIRINNGDNTAIEELFSHSGKLVFSVAIKYLHNREAAEDVTADVFENLEKIAKNYQPWQNAYNYICVISKNRALDYIRSNDCRYQREQLYGGEDIREKLNNFSIDEIEKLTMIEAMEKLNNNELEIIYYTYWYGYTLREYAKQKNQSLSMVYRCLLKAKKNFKKEVEKIEKIN